MCDVLLVTVHHNLLHNFGRGVHCTSKDCWSWQVLFQCTNADQAVMICLYLGSEFAFNDNEQSPDCRLVKWASSSNTCIMQTAAA